jgi:excisionase family DNA binding protein
MSHYLMVNEVAEQCRVHPSTVRRWLKSGEMKHKRAGFRVLIESSELERFIGSTRQK